MYRPDNSLLHISILRKSLKRQNHPRSNCSCNFERFCKCRGARSGLHLRFGPFLSVQWLMEWVALAFSGIIASAVALGVDCTCDLGRFCQCRGSGSGLHLHIRAFLRVQWLLEWIALAIWAVFVSAVALGVGCIRFFGHYCECSGSWSGLHLHIRAFLRVQLVGGIIVDAAARERGAAADKQSGDRVAGAAVWPPAAS